MVVWALTLFLIAGCNSTKPATLVQGDWKQITATIIAKTGDGLSAPFTKKLPSGTPVTILDDNPSEPTVKVRIEQGEFKCQEATVARNAIHMAE
jgi:hypothetical protein